MVTVADPNADLAGKMLHKPHEAGFTLLEIIVALVVFGLILVGLTQGLHLGLTAWRQQVRGVEATSDLDSVDRTLRQLLVEMEPGRPIDPVNINGTQQRLAFTSVLPQALQRADWRRADMALLVDARHQLILRWSPHLHVQRLIAAPPPEDAILLPNVMRLELSYWADGGWKGAWQSRIPPTLVRLRLLFPVGDARRWPDIIVAPVRRSISGEAG
jgi:general secretion pathway protein J